MIKLSYLRAYQNIKYKEWSNRLNSFAFQHAKGKYSQIGNCKYLLLIF